MPLQKQSEAGANFLSQISCVKCILNVNLSKCTNLHGQKAFDA